MKWSPLYQCSSSSSSSIHQMNIFCRTKVDLFRRCPYLLTHSIAIQSLDIRETTFCLTAQGLYLLPQVWSWGQPLLRGMSVLRRQNIKGQQTEREPKYFLACTTAMEGAVSYKMSGRANRNISLGKRSREKEEFQICDLLAEICLPFTQWLWIQI